MTTERAPSARLGWRRFLPTRTRISTARRLHSRAQWLADWLAPEIRWPMVPRVRLAQELIADGNSLAEWLAPEIAEVANDRRGEEDF